MKRLLIGLLTLTSISAYADLDPKCHEELESISLKTQLLLVKGQGELDDITVVSYGWDEDTVEIFINRGYALSHGLKWPDASRYEFKGSFANGECKVEAMTRTSIL